MFGIENYTGFILAAIILNLTPGADTFYILTRSVSMGRKAGMLSVAGIMTGCIVHVVCAAFGLSLLLATSARIFFVVKWVGALYLIYLGIRALLEKSHPLDPAANATSTSDYRRIYRQGILTNVLNPKVALFFLSFLPQFINPEAVNGPAPFLILGGTFLFTGTVWCLCLSWLAASMTRMLRAHAVIGILLQKVSGLIFIGFGLKLAMARD